MFLAPSSPSSLYVAPPHARYQTLEEVVAEDSPDLLEDYIQRNPVALTEIDEEGNTLLMLLIRQGAERASMYLLVEYAAHQTVAKQNIEGRTALHYACFKKSFRLAEKLCEMGASHVCMDVHGQTPFHISIANASSEIALYFIRTNPTHELYEPLFVDGVTNPLHLAADSSEAEVLEKVATLTTKYNLRDEEGRSALHRAVGSKTCIANTRVLLKLQPKVAIDAEDARARTPFWLSCHAGNRELATLLRSEGASPDKGWPCPLIMASLKNEQELVQTLLDEGASLEQLFCLFPIREILALLGGTRLGGAEILHSLSEDDRQTRTSSTGEDQRAENKQSPGSLHRQVLNEDTIPKILQTARPERWNEQNSDGKTPFFILCEEGTLLSCYRVLQAVKRGLSINVTHQDNAGNTVLHATLKEENTECFLLLLRHLKSAIDTRNSSGDTPLHVAVRMRNTLGILVLLKYGANPNIQNNNGDMPLHLVCSIKGKPENEIMLIIDQLVLHGAQLNSLNKMKWHPLACAMMEDNHFVFDYLLRIGANPNAPMDEGNRLLMLSCDRNDLSSANSLVKAGANVNARSDRRCVLHVAVDASRLAFVTLFLNPRSGAKDRVESAADPDIQIDGVTALGIVLQNIADKKSPDDAKIFAELLQHKVNVNQRMAIGSRQITPIAYCAEENLVSELTELLRHGADPDGWEKKGARPIEIASRKGSEPIVRALIAGKAKIPKKLSKDAQVSANIKTLLLAPKLPAVIQTRAQPLELSRLRRATVDRNQQPLVMAQAAVVSAMGKLSIAKRKKDDPALQKRRAALQEKLSVFMRSDSFDEELMRQNKMLVGEPLMRQASRKLPQSVCRLGKSIHITVGKEVIIDQQTTFKASESDADVISGETTKKEKVSKEVSILLLGAFNKAISWAPPRSDVQAEKIKLLSTFEVKSDEEIKKLDVIRDDKVVSQNRDIMALKLLTKECASIAIVPLYVQVRSYSDAQNKPYTISVNKQDQWQKVVVNRLQRGFRADAKTCVGINYAYRHEQKAMLACTIDIEALLLVSDVTGKLQVVLKRSNLKFEEGVPIEVQEFIYDAVNAPITYETRPIWMQEKG